MDRSKLAASVQAEMHSVCPGQTGPNFPTKSFPPPLPRNMTTIEFFDRGAPLPISANYNNNTTSGERVCCAADGYLDEEERSRAREVFQQDMGRIHSDQLYPFVGLRQQQLDSLSANYNGYGQAMAPFPDVYTECPATYANNEGPEGEDPAWDSTLSAASPETQQDHADDREDRDEGAIAEDKNGDKMASQCAPAYPGAAAAVATNLSTGTRAFGPSETLEVRNLVMPVLPRQPRAEYEAVIQRAEDVRRVQVELDMMARVARDFIAFYGDTFETRWDELYDFTSDDEEDDGDAELTDMSEDEDGDDDEDNEMDREGPGGQGAVSYDSNMEATSAADANKMTTT